MTLLKDTPHCILLNGASIEVYKDSLIFKDDERDEIIGELEWKDIYMLAEEYLEPDIIQSSTQTNNKQSGE